MSNSEIPYFVEIRGCINCEASKYAKEKTGKDYIFIHENLLCLFRNCFGFGHELHRPYIDPEEFTRMAIERSDPKFINWVKEALLGADDAYRRWFETVGISLDNLIEQLEAR